MHAQKNVTQKSQLTEIKVIAKAKAAQNVKSKRAKQQEQMHINARVGSMCVCGCVTQYAPDKATKHTALESEYPVVCAVRTQSPPK